MEPELALQLFKNGLVLGLLYGLFAYGLSMVLAATGIFHLANLSALATGAYGLWWFLELGVPAPLAVFGACVAGGVAGLVIELFIYRPLRKANAGELGLMVASLTVLTLGQGLLSVAFGSDSKVIPQNSFMSWKGELLGVNIRTFDVLVVVASAVVFAGLFAMQKYTRMGLAFRALGDNPELARLRGVRVGRTYVVLMVMAGAIAGLTGVLVGAQNAASPGMGFELLVMSVIALAIGGVGNMQGALLAGIGVGLVESFLSYVTNSGEAHLALFGLLFLLMFLRPNGIGVHATRVA